MIKKQVEPLKIKKLADKIWDDITLDECYHPEYEDHTYLVVGTETLLDIDRATVLTPAAKILTEGYIYKRSDVLPDHKRGINEIYIQAIRANYTFNELLELGYNFKEINKILKQQEEK